MDKISFSLCWVQHLGYTMGMGEGGHEVLGPIHTKLPLWGPTGQGDALLVPGLPLAVLIQGTAPAAGLLVTVVHGVILRAILIYGNGDLEHGRQKLFCSIHRAN